MPKLPDIQISVENPTATDRANRYESERFSASVDADGVFTATLPEHLSELARALALPPGVSVGFGRSYWRMQGKQLDLLKHALQDLMKAWVAPTVTVERVIRYNVESHISFFEGVDGSIFPNGSFNQAGYDSGGRWNDSKKYGGHSAQQPSRGGYSLTIGAKVVDKKTIVRGEATKIEYARIDNIKHDEQDPLFLLNSWMSFTLPEFGVKEMPYTPEAALFFHQMMLGMADLSRRVQTFFHDEARLLEAISKGQLLLPA